MFFAVVFVRADPGPHLVMLSEVETSLSSRASCVHSIAVRTAQCEYRMTSAVVLGGHIGPPLRVGIVIRVIVGADRRVCPLLFAVYILSHCLRGTSNRVAEGVYCVFAFSGGHIGPPLRLCVVPLL